MNNDIILKRLFENQDIKYRDFSSKLIPDLSIDEFIGVRAPVLKKIAKEYKGSDYEKKFLVSLPHNYHDENILHAFFISQMKDCEEIFRSLDKFLPYVNNWAVCDSICPNALRKYKSELIGKINNWVQSNETYRVRFAVKMLMTFFLDESFEKEFLDIPLSIKSEEYYINMMISWFYATALAKKWDEAIVYLTDNKLDKWVHNMTIKKARESYRISSEQKEILKKLKI